MGGLTCLAVICAFVNAADAEVVTWGSQPVKANETLLLSVIGMTNATVVQVRQGEGSWQQLETFGVNGFGCAVTVPPSFTDGEFEVRAGTSGDPFLVNAASPYFIFGDQGDFSTPGGWVRVIGATISLAPQVSPAKIMLENADSGTFQIKARKISDGSDGKAGTVGTRWHSFFDIAADIDTGVYKISVASSLNGSFVPLCTFISSELPCLDTLNVSKSTAWKKDVFDVMKYGAVQPGPGRNHTGAYLAALDAATKNGGGIIYFPRGQYFLDTPIVVPTGTVVAGAAAALTAIYFAEAGVSNAPDAYITSAAAENTVSWGVRDLTVYVTAFAHNIIRFQPDSKDCFMRRVRVRFNSYFCLEAAKGSGSRGRNTGEHRPT
jgi:hypothetical protein